uniref:REJ domain-containing protein n=1 Tax=Sus scrofa TaxID=9823 RepID=A0A8D1F878_PIG
DWWSAPGAGSLCLPPPPHSPTHEMSDAQDPATVPVPAVGTQVKLRGRSSQDEGRESFHFHQHQQLQAFLSLLEHSYLQDFLSKDPCFQISDKYLLAMVLVYFRRANLKLSEYTLSNLFLALYLANDMEEDLEDPKCVIFPWALGRDWHHRVSYFLQQRTKLWARMGFRAFVSRQSCEEVMTKEPTHWAWTRERRPHHGRAQRSYPKAQIPLPRGPGLSPPHCPLCGSRPLPVSSKCPSPNPGQRRPPFQASVSVAEDQWGGGFLIVLPTQLRLEPGTYTLRSELGPPPQVSSSLTREQEDLQKSWHLHWALNKVKSAHAGVAEMRHRILERQSGVVIKT